MSEAMPEMPVSLFLVHLAEGLIEEADDPGIRLLFFFQKGTVWESGLVR